MGAADVLYYVIHYQELRSIIQWKTVHQPVHERNEEKESPSLKTCFEFLAQTSRSFSAVILELHPELLVPVALFYLILRGLDTIEDDMTLPLDQKVPLLRRFYKVTTEEGWSFDGNGPHEKDRDLLVKFHYVVEEFRKVKPEYQEIIKDITRKMGNGMADYANNAEHNANGVNTIKEYDLYCHYVAGLVGNGLTRLFVKSRLANPALEGRPHLQESMGLFLQKTNIIRDVKEDFDDRRRFWPKEIWSKYVDNFEDLFKPENLDTALNCSSEMVLNSITHADECIFYLAGLKEQSVFNFAAIPQSMAIATLELVFRNPAIFQTNVKITKGQACQIMLESTQNLEVLCSVFRRFIRKIHKKNTPRDPNFLKISMACAKVEQFIDSTFPPRLPKALVRNNISRVESQRAPGTPEPGRSVNTGDAKDTSNKALSYSIYLFLDQLTNPHSVFTILAVVATLFTLSCMMFGIAYLFGARFDIAINDLFPGRILQAAQQGRQSAKQTYDHNREL